MVTREVVPPSLPVAASVSPEPTEPAAKLREPTTLDPDTFAHDLREAQELLHRIEARDISHPSPSRDTSWEPEVSELRSRLEP